LFADIILIAYLLGLLAGLIYLGQRLLRLLGSIGMPPEKRILLAASLMALLAFIGALYGFRINAWRETRSTAETVTAPTAPPARTPAGTQPDPAVPTNSSPTQTTEVSPSAANTAQSSPTTPPTAQKPLSEQEQLHIFEESYFPELHTQRLHLYQDIKNLEAQANRISTLAREAPKQRALLRELYDSTLTSYRLLQAHYQATNRQLLEFWIHYRTGDPDYATTRFEPVADRLVGLTREIRADWKNRQDRETAILRKYLDRTTRLFQSHRIPAYLAGKITSYSPRNRQRLLEWVSQQANNDMDERLQTLQQQRREILKGIDQLRKYMQQLPVLKPRLEQTLVQWNTALEANHYAEYRLLNGVELAWLPEQLQLEHGKPVLDRFRRTLFTETGSISHYAGQMFEKAREAYHPEKPDS